jgi:predicted Zn-dependent protease
MQLSSRLVLLRILPIFSTLITFSALIGCATVDVAAANKEEELIGVQLDIATNQLDVGHAEKALQTMKPLVSTFPNNSKVLTLIGMIHLALSNPDQALVFLRRSYDRDPSAASGLNLSSALIASGQHPRARNVLRKLLKSNENYQYKERLLHNIAVAYLKERNFLAAKKYLRQSLETNPGYYMSLIVLAKIEKETGIHSAAIEHLKRAVKACPSCYEPVHLLSTEYINDNQIRSALTLLDNFAKNEDIAPEDKESGLKMQQYLELKNPAAVQAARKESAAKRIDLFKNSSFSPIATQNDSTTKY